MAEAAVKALAICTGQQGNDEQRLLVAQPAELVDFQSQACPVARLPSIALNSFVIGQGEGGQADPHRADRRERQNRQGRRIC